MERTINEKKALKKIYASIILALIGRCINFLQAGFISEVGAWLMIISLGFMYFGAYELGWEYKKLSLK